MAFVSITRLRVRTWRYLPAFIIQALRSARQASLAPGNLALALLRDANLTFWTRTVWSEEAATARLHARERASHGDAASL